MQKTPKSRPSACVPCHQRKVRCDAGVTGTPCSRCLSKDRSSECTLVPPRVVRKEPNRGRIRRQNSNRNSRGPSCLREFVQENATYEHSSVVYTLFLLFHISHGYFVARLIIKIDQYTRGIRNLPSTAR